jgi:hypothetical protein
MRRLCTDSSRSYLGRSAPRAVRVDGDKPGSDHTGTPRSKRCGELPAASDESAALTVDDTARRAATCAVMVQKSAEVVVGPKGLKDRTSQLHGGAERTSAWPLNPTGRGLAGGERVTGHERYRDEPPTADPHGGWCGGRGLAASGYPISHHWRKRSRIAEDLMKYEMPEWPPIATPMCPALIPTMRPSRKEVAPEKERPGIPF